MHELLSKAKFEQDVASVSDEAARRIGLIVHSRVYPTLDILVEHSKPIRFRVICKEWDELPPSVEILAADGVFWNVDLPGGVFHGGPHPTTGRPFICMRGSLEFHTHFSHKQEVWENYRGQDGMGIWGLIFQLASAWRTLVK